MARNRSRKNRPAANSNSQTKKAEIKNTEAVNEPKPASAADAAVTDAAVKSSVNLSGGHTKSVNDRPPESGATGSGPGEVLYQVKTKRDSALIRAFITFTYRVMHPKVSARLVFYGIIIALPGIFYFKDPFWRVFFTAIGAALILLGFFRQYISAAITKRNDPDYRNGTEFTYNFGASDGEFLKNGERISGLGKYKNIAGFYYDDDFFYLSLKNKDLIVLPKKAFTKGDPESFEDFIYKKSRKTCHWLPVRFSDQMKKRRAVRAAEAAKNAKR